MRTIRNTALEALALILLACAAGLAGNTARQKGLDLGRDYFPTLPPRLPGVTGGGPVQAETGSDEELFVPAGIEEITLDEATAFFQDPEYDPTSSQSRYVFVDARDDESYAESHIPGARQLDHYHKEQYLPDVLAAIDEADKVIVYCNGGECEDSILVITDLLEEGVDAGKILLFKTGWESWEAAGLPFEKGEY